MIQLSLFAGFDRNCAAGRVLAAGAEGGGVPPICSAMGIDKLSLASDLHIPPEDHLDVTASAQAVTTQD